MSTFVTVGNATQPFSRLLDAVATLVADLPQPVFVQHGSTPFAAEHCTCAAFVPMDEFERRVADADLLIMHAGAGSVLTAVRAGKVPVVMSRQAAHGEHVDDHQVEFARALAGIGRIVRAAEAPDLRTAVHTALARQRDAKASHDPPAAVAIVAEALRRHASR